MNQEEKNELFYGAITAIASGFAAVPILEQVFEAGHTDGRESVLKEAQELVTGRSSYNQTVLEQAHKAQQAADTIKALSDWCDLDQVSNRYDVGKTSLEDDLKRYKVTMWNTPNHGGEAHTYLFGSTMLDALAKAAFWALLEIDHVKRNRK